MLTPKKKLSRKELKKDALVDSYVRATTFYTENKRVISIVGGIVAVLVIALIIYGRNRSENNVGASTALGSVIQLFDNGQYQLAIDGIPERNIKGLKAIVDDYGNSHMGDIGRFYLGNAYYGLGKYSEALEQFKKFSPSDDGLEVSRLSGIGCCYEGLGQYKEAAENFEKAGMKDPKNPSSAENLSNAARDYAKAGQKEEALDLLRKLKKDYPATTYGRDAEKEITALSL